MLYNYYFVISNTFICICICINDNCKQQCIMDIIYIMNIIKSKQKYFMYKKYVSFCNS